MPRAFSECPPPASPNPQVQKVEDLVYDGFKILNFLSTKDIPLFCQENSRQWALSTMYLDTSRTAEDFLESGRSTDPWGPSIFPDSRVRQLAITKNSDLQSVGVGSLNGLRAYLRDPNPPPRRGYKNYTLKGIAEPTAPGLMLGGAKADLQSDLSFHLACNQVHLGLACGHALKRAVEMASISSANYSFPDLYRKVLTDPSYDRGLIDAALLLTGRAEAKDANGADLFSDLKTSFQTTGDSEKAAEEKAWDIVGLIGTGGANLGWRVMGLNAERENTQSAVALTAIASLAPLLDSYSGKGKHIYSYPRSVKTTCDMGKSYHFWLTAYLARRLAQEGTDPKVASLAAFTAQKGYEMFSKTQGRYPHLVLSSDLFSYYPNTIRTDLAFSAAGAIYGAKSPRGREPKLNVDEGIRRNVRGAWPVVKLTEQKAKSLSAMKYAALFWAVINPNAAYHYYEWGF